MWVCLLPNMNNHDQPTPVLLTNVCIVIVCLCVCVCVEGCMLWCSCGEYRVFGAHGLTCLLFSQSAARKGELPWLHSQARLSLV